MGKRTPATPKQQRSIQTRQKIKETAYRLYETRGYHAVTSNDIAAEAGVNIGTFYHYFENKKVLLLELLEDFQKRFFHQAFDQLPPKMGSLTSREAIAFMVKKSFDAFRKEKGFFSSVYPLQYMDPDVEKIFRKYERLESTRAAEIYAQVTGLGAPGEIKKQITTVSIIVATVSNRFYTLGLPMGKKETIHALTEMIHAYLTAAFSAR